MIILLWLFNITVACPTIIAKTELYLNNPQYMQDVPINDEPCDGHYSRELLRIDDSDSCRCPISLHTGRTTSRVE